MSEYKQIALSLKIELLDKLNTKIGRGNRSAWIAEAIEKKLSDEL